MRHPLRRNAITVTSQPQGPFQHREPGSDPEARRREAPAPEGTTSAGKQTLRWSGRRPSRTRPRPLPRDRRQNRKTIPRWCPLCRAQVPAHRPQSPGRTMTRVRPMHTDSTPVQNRFIYGSISEKGSAPRTENQITYFRPIRSPISPPASVPTATGMRNSDRYKCAAAQRHAEMMHQIEGVIGLDAREIDLLREDQREQNQDRGNHLTCARARVVTRASPRFDAGNRRGVCTKGRRNSGLLWRAAPSAQTRRSISDRR